MNKVCIVSTCRSDFGIISNLVKNLGKQKKIKSSFIIYDIHENKKIGQSINEIINKKIKIDFIVKTSKKSFRNKELLLSNKIGSSTLEISKILDKIKPNLLILYGDRIELMPFVISSIIMRTPVAHINGGEITSGAYDELVRHAITKIANYHFVSSEKNKNILINMGEDKKNIFNVGHLVYENINNIKIFKKEELEKDLNFKFKEKNALFSFHPVTYANDYGIHELKILLNCIEKYNEIQFFLSYPNYDVGHQDVIDLLLKYTKKNKNFVLRKSFGHENYLSMLKNVDFIIGNSSSGILEAPIFKTATINVGDRQKGRLRTNSIIDCNCEFKEINKAIKIVYSNKFKNELKKTKLQYSKKKSVEMIIKKIKSIIKKNNFKKNFIL